MSFPPIGETVTAPAIVAAAFGVMGVTLVAFGVRTKLIAYHLMGLSAFARCTAMAIRAASVANDYSNRAEMIAYFICMQAGFALTVDMQAFVTANWFKNTHDHLAPPLAAVWRKVSLLCGLFAILLGAGLGVPACILLYGTFSSEATIEKAQMLRKGSSAGMLVVVCICFLLALGATVWTLLHHREFKPSEHIHQRVFVLILTSLAMIWAAAARLYSVYENPHFGVEDEKFFCAQMLGELVQVGFWCWPYIMLETHHSSQFDEIMAASMHGRRSTKTDAAGSSTDGDMAADGGDIEIGQRDGDVGKGSSMVSVDCSGADLDSRNGADTCGKKGKAEGPKHSRPTAVDRAATSDLVRSSTDEEMGTDGFIPGQR